MHFRQDICAGRASAKPFLVNAVLDRFDLLGVRKDRKFLAGYSVLVGDVSPVLSKPPTTLIRTVQCRIDIVKTAA